MTRILLVALGAALVFLLAPAPLALAGKKGPQLPPGPNTLSGPAAVGLRPGSSRNVWSSQFPLGVCMSVAVTGRAQVFIFLMKTPNTQARGIRVESGDSGVLCHPGADLAGVTCSGSSPTDCAAVWRIDEY